MTVTSDSSAQVLALRHGACPDARCTNQRRTTFHMDPADCPYGPVSEVTR